MELEQLEPFQRGQRGVRIPGGMASDRHIVRLAHEIARSDRLFEEPTEAELQQMVGIGTLFRAARRFKVESVFAQGDMVMDASEEADL